MVSDSDFQKEHLSSVIVTKVMAFKSLLLIDQNFFFNFLANLRGGLPRQLTLFSFQFFHVEKTVKTFKRCDLIIASLLD